MGQFWGLQTGAEPGQTGKFGENTCVTSNCGLGHTWSDFGRMLALSVVSASNPPGTTHSNATDGRRKSAGDANQNGQPDAADAVILAYFAANPGTLPPSDILLKMDLDSDGILTSTDLLQLLNYLAGNQNTLGPPTTTTSTTVIPSTTTTIFEPLEFDSMNPVSLCANGETQVVSFTGTGFGSGTAMDVAELGHFLCDVADSNHAACSIPGSHLTANAVPGINGGGDFAEFTLSLIRSGNASRSTFITVVRQGTGGCN